MMSAHAQSSLCNLETLHAHLHPAMHLPDPKIGGLSMLEQVILSSSHGEKALTDYPIVLRS